MTTIAHPAFEHDDDSSWSVLILRLQRQVRMWVFTSHVSSWKGEEEETIQDIVSEAVTRTLDRLHKANRGDDSLIVSIYGFARQTAYNYFIDLLRKDCKCLRLSQLTADHEEPAIGLFLADIEEAVLNAVCNEQFFKLMAQEITKFPKKQKEAILRDHARLMAGMADPTSLLRAYQSIGIQLKDYHNYAPTDNIERRRHSSLLHHAYRRLSHLPSMRRFITRGFAVENA